jgi:hypothetical protein
MFRGVSLIVAVVAGVLLVPAARTAEPAVLKPGEKFEGETSVQKLSFTYDTYTWNAHFADVPIVLKAGQSIAISATVPGKDRKVSLILVDPSDKAIAYSKAAGTKAVQLVHEEVNANGKYKIVVHSDYTGPFTLQANVSTDDELGIKVLEERIKQLEAELAETRAKLKAKQDK